MDPPSKRPKRKATGLTSVRLFNADSPITAQESDIQSFLSICLLNWSRYSEDEKITIISTLPLQYRTQKSDGGADFACPIDPEVVANDKVLRDQIARFKRDVKDGFYTKTWQDKGRKAMEDRANGKFDGYLSKHAEEMFVDEDDQEDDAEGDTDGEYGSNAKTKGGHKNGRKEQRLSRALAASGDVEDDEG